MSDVEHNILWILLTVVSIVSILNVALFFKLLKKHDVFQLQSLQIFESLNTEFEKLSTVIEMLKKRGRMMTNEIKNNEKRHREHD